MPNSTETDLLVALSSLHNKIQKRLNSSLSMHGISYTEYLVLRNLEQERGKKLRRIDLAQRIGLSASGVTRLLNPMQKIGLVKKEEIDRDARVSLVALTRAGERVFKEANTTFLHTGKDLLSPLNSKDQTMLAKLALALI